MAKKKSADLFDEAPVAKAKKSAAKPKAAEKGYSAADIEVLEAGAGAPPPGMYIGGTDSRAMHHLFAEVIDNSMDEAVAGHASFIESRVHGRQSPVRAIMAAAVFG